ncbi:glycosyltransferase family 2 protein [Hominiventricola aquisgranensis]|jgi:GT2 family glycosyltransferase|uniref:Glycosyltransferase family 2 protein n=1 Tax=Hominiventricola aquisgranensis TaxID=3133164 RepID=A0ABV1HXH6_9FIRM|nr:glycosyltransferase family 2 protein [Clostridiales bacterium AM23-16LB]RHW04230.1 glycosyltransferase family 2 protein [Clostridiaceae bacterium OF09-1]
MSEENKKAELPAHRDKRFDGVRDTWYWKLSKPVRVVVHFVIRTRNAYIHYGGFKGMYRRWKQKKGEASKRLDFGTKSFPNAEERRREEETVFPREIKISVLVPLYNTPEKFLREMIDSVVTQTYKNWELCLADGSDDKHTDVGRICQEYIEKDSRIKYQKIEKNLGISGNTNVCFSMATGNFIGLFDHDDVMHPSLLFECVKTVCEKDADYVYTDEATFTSPNLDDLIVLHFKPDYSPDNLRANNYICHFSMFDADLLKKTGLFRPEYDGSQDHDMILRLTEEAKHVCHIPKILYYWRSHPNSVAADIGAKTYAIDAAKRAVHDHMRDYYGIEVEVESTRAFPTIFQIKYPINGEPLISIVIPNKDHVEDLRRCITSIEKKSTWKNYEIVVVENNSVEQSIRDYYKELESDPKVKIVTYEGGFNYSRINNVGVKETKGEYLLFLNNDTEVISPDWMEQLLMYAQRKDVGAVGAKLYYADNTIQHAGVVIGLGAHRSAGHTHYKMPREHLGYMGRLCYAQDVTAVTGACLMVKKSIYEEVDGLDESFTISLNDVDLCLKIREKGYLNIFTPFAELYHYESKTRGMEEGEKLRRYERECAHFRDKWKEQLDAGDPYYNPNFSLDYSDFTLRF